MALSPDVVADKTCSEKHLAQISVWITEWREISPFLGLTAAEEQEILGTVPPLSVRSQKIAMLRLWKEKRGAKATYKRLCQAFRECDMLDFEEKVKKLLEVSSSSSSDEEGELVCRNVIYSTHIAAIFRPGKGFENAGITLSK